VSIVLCQSEDLVDDRLSWLLTNPDNIDKLDEDKSKNIKIELKKILEKFNNEVKENNIFTTSETRKYTRQISFDEDEYYRLRKKGYSEAEAQMYGVKTSYKTKNAIKTRGFDLNVRLSTQIPEWSDIIEYYGGYSELIGVGIKKEDLERFRVNKELKRVEIADPKSCVAIIEIKGEKDYGLKFYDLEGTQQMIFGTHQLDDFTITDLYYISKSDINSSPKIKFTFTDQELVQSKQDVFIKSVIDINNKIVELSKPHLSTIEMMIDDLVPLSYYNTFSHRKQLAEEKALELKKLAEEKALELKKLAEECEKLLNNLKSLALSELQHYLSSRFYVNDIPKHPYTKWLAWKLTRKEYIKKYKKKYRGVSPIINDEKLSINYSNRSTQKSRERLSPKRFYYLLDMNFFRFFENTDYAAYAGDKKRLTFRKELNLYKEIKYARNYKELLSVFTESASNYGYNNRYYNWFLYEEYEENYRAYDPDWVKWIPINSHKLESELSDGDTILKNLQLSEECN